MSYLYLKFFIGYLTHVTAAILQLCMNTNFWSFLKAFPPGFFSNSTNGNYIFPVLRPKKKNNPLFLDSILLYPHIKFISKFYWLSLPSKYWQIPKSEKFPDALTVEGLGSIPGLRELRSHKPHSTAKKKSTTNFQILTTFHSFYCYLHYHILSQLLPYPLTGSPAIALCLPPTILKVVCRLCAMLC